MSRQEREYKTSHLLPPFPPPHSQEALQSTPLLEACFFAAFRYPPFWEKYEARGALQIVSMSLHRCIILFGNCLILHTHLYYSISDVVILFSDLTDAVNWEFTSFSKKLILYQIYFEFEIIFQL